jgi:hypothetical protein
MRFDPWFRRLSTQQLPIGLLWFILASEWLTRVSWRIIFAKFHVLEAELHLLSEKENHCFHEIGTKRLSVT